MRITTQFNKLSSRIGDLPIFVLEQWYLLHMKACHSFSYLRVLTKMHHYFRAITKHIIQIQIKRSTQAVTWIKVHNISNHNRLSSFFGSLHQGCCEIIVGLPVWVLAFGSILYVPSPLALIPDPLLLTVVFFKICRRNRSCQRAFYSLNCEINYNDSVCSHKTNIDHSYQNHERLQTT